MKLAAVDIGSNAIRMQITNVIEFEGVITFKKLEYVRFPIRLGQDVFNLGEIGPAKQEKFFKLMQAYKNLIDLYEVTDYYGCATSAMREAKNGQELVEKVKSDLDLSIDIISGREEAEIINKVIGHYLDEKAYVHIDVGGGSTELNIYKNKEKIKSKSFKLGSVRRLQHHDSPEIWKEMDEWVHEHINKEFGPVQAIGTGGNINKIYELSGQSKKHRKISIETVEEVRSRLAAMNEIERQFKLQLNPDRADVIVPASDIYLGVMKAAHANEISVPDVGLKDGIMYQLFRKHYTGDSRVWFKN
ncbi:MAG: phosphatase [bacterium]|nr:phosphatase [bacterium]